MTYILPLLAVLLGYLIALAIKKTTSGINLLLAFSGAFLLSITVFEFIPHVYHSEASNIGVFVMLGILIQLMLEFLSGGAEHGHTHYDIEKSHFPWALFFSLCIHSLLEGFPIGQSDTLLVAVVIHKMPVAIIISSFLLKTQLKKWQVLLFVLLFGLMTPLGHLLSDLLNQFKTYLTYVDAVVVGIFLHISTTILFESQKNHRFNASKFIVIVIGIVAAYFLGHAH